MQVLFHTAQQALIFAYHLKIDKNLMNCMRINRNFKSTIGMKKNYHTLQLHNYNYGKVVD